MIEFIAENLAPIMFMSLIVFLLLGYPVAFALAANGLLFFVIGVELSAISPEIRLFWPLLQSHPERIWGIMSNETLLAIPFFTFMGIVLERSGMAEDLLDTVGQVFGPIRGRVPEGTGWTTPYLERFFGRQGPDRDGEHSSWRILHIHT